jgi:pyroglutamyl-peptidase
VHVPYTPEQVAGRDDIPSMALAAQVEGIRQALRSAVRTREDVRETAGREH